MSTVDTYGPPATSVVVLPHGRKPPAYGPSLRFTRVDGPAGGLWLLPEISNGGRDWRPVADPSRWTPNDLVTAAEWFEGVCAGEEFVRDRYLWFASPAVAFGLIEWHDEGRLAIDVCLMLDALAPWPTFSVGGSGDMHEDAYYLTVDLTHDACAEAALSWRCWADWYGRTAVGRD